MGGILGGLIGNKFGKGKGKDAATVAGVLLGASLVHDDELSKSKTSRIVTREVCETKYRNEFERRLSNYLVKYSYDGRIFTDTTTIKPTGKSIKVRVRVSPEQ
ncbi:Putative exported protein [hydrothermal vent metagenome]